MPTQQGFQSTKMESSRMRRNIIEFEIQFSVFGIETQIERLHFCIVQTPSGYS